MPRFTPEAVSAALSGLADRVKAVNQDRGARFRVTKAVAFGDFLSGRARVQAPDVGVELTPRVPVTEAEPGSALEEAAKRGVLRQSERERRDLEPSTLRGLDGAPRAHRKISG
jgi:hypothetical protein